MGDVIYGRVTILEILRISPDIVETVYIKRGVKGGIIHEIIGLLVRYGIRKDIVSEPFLSKLSKTTHHQGIVARIRDFQYSTVEEILGDCTGLPIIIALDMVQDTGNLGAIIRSAVFFGADGIIIPVHGSCPINATVFKTSAGAVVRTRVARVKNLGRTLTELKDKGIWVYGFEGGEGLPLSSSDMSRPLCLVFGSEGRGLRRGVKEKCEAIFSIKGAGKFDSLNVSCATSIVLYEISRQRGLLNLPLSPDRGRDETLPL